MRGLRFSQQRTSTSRPRFAVGAAEPKTRIRVEKLVAFARGIYASAPTLATLAIFVNAQQQFSDELDERIHTLGLTEEYLEQTMLDLDRWMIRLSHYAAWIELAMSGAGSVWVTEQGEIVNEGAGDLEMPIEDFIEIYLVRPLLYGDAYTIPSAEYEGTQNPEGWVRFPDIGTGFSMVNQLNEVGAIFDDASLLEKRFGIWLEIAAQIKQSELGQMYANEIEFVMMKADEALQSTSDFIEEAAKKGAAVIIGLLAVAVLGYGYAKGR